MRRKLKKRNFNVMESSINTDAKNASKDTRTFTRRRAIIGIICSIILLGLIGTYAFYTANMTIQNEEANVTTGTLALIFEDGNTGIEEQLEFGGSVEKTFTIENKGTLDATAIMFFDKLINTYTLGSLTYTLEYSESETGTYTELVTNQNVPRSEKQSSRTLASSLSVPADKKYYYKPHILNY